MIKKNFLFIGLCFLFVGCKISKTTSDESILYEIYLDDAIKKSFTLSDIADSIEYVYLQEPVTADYISKIDVSENYALFRESLSGRILLFHRDGRFINQIGLVGNGPGEYARHVYDVLLDEKRNAIYVLELFEGRILQYEINGSFVTTITLGHDACSMGLIEPGYIIVHIGNWTGDKENRFVIINDKGDIVKEFKNPYKYTMKHGGPWKPECIKYIYNNNLHIKDKGDTLYMVSKDHQLIPRFVFKNKCSIPSNNLTQEQYDRAIQFLSAFETDQRLYFTFYSCNKTEGKGSDLIRHAYFEKKTGKTYIYKPEKNEFRIKNDIDDALYFTWSQNNACLFHTRTDFDDSVFEKAKPEVREKIQKLRSSINDEDPAFLSILYLKK